VFQARLGDEAAPPSLPNAQSFEHETGEDLPDGHAADAEPVAELRFRRDRVAGHADPGADTIPQELLDPGMNGDGAGLGAHVLFRKNARQFIV